MHTERSWFVVLSIGSNVQLPISLSNRIKWFFSVLRGDFRLSFHLTAIQRICVRSHTSKKKNYYRCLKSLSGTEEQSVIKTKSNPPNAAFCSVLVFFLQEYRVCLYHIFAMNWFLYIMSSYFSFLIMRAKHRKQHPKSGFEAFDFFMELLRHIQHIHQNDLEKSLEINLLFMNTFSNCTEMNVVHCEKSIDLQP